MAYAAGAGGGWSSGSARLAASVNSAIANYDSHRPLRRPELLPLSPARSAKPQTLRCAGLVGLRSLARHPEGEGV